mgnify:CR=1 FL=1
MHSYLMKILLPENPLLQLLLTEFSVAEHP